MPAPLALLLAALAAGAMGFAIRRGGTCMVSALDEVVTHRRATKLSALVEASLWVAGGLLLLGAFGRLATPPTGYAIGAATLLGGAVLGLGAFVNGACVFGSVARLGSGEFAWALTPPGFLLGAWMAEAAGVPHAMATGDVAPLLAVAAPIAGVAALLMLSRGRAHVAAYRSVPTGRWSPHLATLAIGAAFLLLFVAVGRWAYTDVLIDAARGSFAGIGWRAPLLAALFLGAALGGPARLVAPGLADAVRCVGGGALMGLGSAVIPGSNDGLILVGLPLLQPYALAALVAMAATILGALALRRALR